MYENQKKYMAVAIGNKISIASTGTPSVQIKFQTLYCMDDIDQKPENKTLWANLYLSDDCFERTMKVLTEVFGFNSDNIQELNDDTMRLSGIEAVLITGIEEYQGRTKEVVKFINHPNGGIGKKADDSDVAKLANQLRGKIRAYIKNKPNSKPVKVDIQGLQNMREQSTSTPSENDLPF